MERLLSKSKEQNRIDDVYYPLLHNEHNREKNVKGSGTYREKTILCLKSIITNDINVMLRLF